MIRINNQFIEHISREAKSSPRQRINYNFHNLEDPVNRLLNAMEPGTYIQPHKHENPDKFEVFLALRGKFLVILFDDKGNVKEHEVLDPQKGNFGVEIPAKIYHTLLPLEKGSVAYEIKEGPYIPASAKNFAPWAPAEGDMGVKKFMLKLLEQVGINEHKEYP